jgi:hypothetical protein
MKQIKDFFIAVDPTLDPEGKFSYTKSKFPCVQCDEVKISTNAALIETDAEEVKTISFRSSIPQSDFVKYKRGSFEAWYNNESSLKKYRLRVIVCLNEQNAEELDLLAQRFNEYQQGLMPMSGQAGVQPFLRSLRKKKGPEAMNLSLNRLLERRGPFDLDYLSTVTKNQFPEPLFYDRNGVLSNVVVYDAPLSNIIEKEGDGFASVEKDETMLVYSGDNQSNIRRIKLKPFDLKIGFGQEYENINLQHLSYYTFLYNDVDQFLPFGMSPIPVENIKDPRDRKIMLNVGSSFVTICTPMGQRTLFQPQIDGSPIPLPIPFGTPGDNIAPDSNKLEDMSDIDRITIQNIDNLIHKTFYEELSTSSGMDPQAAEIISNNNFFSELWITKCDRDYARYSFSFDKAAFLSSNSNFPWLYKRKKAVNEMLGVDSILLENEKSEILSVKMKKRIINPTPQVSTNRLGTMLKVKPKGPSYTYPNTIVANPVRIPDIYLESNNSEQDDIIFYEGYDILKDDRLAQNCTTYQYGVDIEVSDPAEFFIRKCAKSLREAETKIMRFYEFVINSPPIGANEPQLEFPVSSGAGLYNPGTGLMLVPMGNILYGDLLASEHITEQINVYVRYLDIFTYMSNQEISDIRRMLNSLMNAREALGLKRIANMISTLLTSLDKVLKVSFPKDPYGQGTTRQSDITSRNHPKLNVLKAEIYFDNLFDFGKEYETGYNYMSDSERGDIENPLGMPTYSKEFLDGRAEQEFNKYFGNYVTDDNPSSLVPNDVPGYVDSSYQYFSPRTIKIYGEQRLNQPSYRNPLQNVVNYDLDRYAELFYDIIATKRETKYLNYPFFELRMPGLASPQQLADAVLHELEFHSCFVEDQEITNIKAPSKTDMPTKVKKAKGSQNKSGKDPSGLFEAVFGTNDNNNASYDTALENINKPYSINATGSFGVVTDPKTDTQLKTSLEEQKAAAKPATKLLFNILGELKLRPSANNLMKYEDESFNSSLVDVQKIGITAQNVKTMIEGPLSFYPNQLKSLYVTAVTQEQTILGSGFDAVRVELEDQDAAPENKIISAIVPGENYPGYVGIRDPMKVYAKMLAFWMNYKQIAVLEYLSGFENMETENIALDFDEVDPQTESFISKVARPVWRKFDFQSYSQNYDKTFLCRWRSFSPNDVSESDSPYVPTVPSKELFDLPIYNNYFILRG